MPLHPALPLALGLGASVATFCGGLTAFRLGSNLSLILGLTAGAVMGVALFDLLPEALELAKTAYNPRSLFLAVAAGLVGYMAFDRCLALMDAGRAARAHLGAGSLTIHSFLDGMGIGLAFQVSSHVGLVVALAVLAHDVSDGINTVSLSLGLGGSEARTVAKRWLIADALAPLLGVSASFAIRLPANALAPLLAVFAGAFLYIGAVELAPRSYRLHPRQWTTAATLLGLAIIYCAVLLAP